MLRHAVIYFACALFAFAHLTLIDAEIQDCGSVAGELKHITVSGCDGKPVCNLVRGSNASIDINFVTKKPISQVKAVVHGIILDVPMPFPLQHPDACSDPASNIHCPLTEGSEHNYHEVLPVHKNYPKMSLKVKWELQDENHENIVCILIPAKLV